MQMKTNRIYLVLSISFLFMAVLSLSAQPPKGGKGQAHGHGPGSGMPDSCHVQLMVDDMRVALGLDEKQVQQIEEIHFSHISEVKAIDSQYQNDCVGARQARWDLRAKMDGEIKAVLSEDQAGKYDEFMENRRGPHGHGHQGWN